MSVILRKIIEICPDDEINQGKEKGGEFNKRALKLVLVLF